MPPSLRDGLRAEGLEPIGSDTQIVPLVIGEAGDAMALCERLLERGDLRPGDPAADRPARHLPPAADRHGHPSGRGPAARRARTVGAAARELGVGLRARSRRPRPRRPATRPPELRGLFVTGTGTEVGKTVVAVGDRPHGACRGRPSRRLQAGGQRPRRLSARARGLGERRRAARTTPCSGSRRDRARADEQIAPYRYGPAGLASPGGGAGRRADRPRPSPRRGARRRLRTRTCWSARESAASWCP